MAIKLDCPRCKKPLSVPSKKIGRYVNCPRCGGRFWVPENAAAHSTDTDASLPGAAGSAPVTPSPQAPQPPQPPDKLSATVSMGGSATISPEGAVPPPPPGQNTAAQQDAGAPPVAGGGSPWQVMPPDVPTPSRPPDAEASKPGQKTARFVSAEAAQSTLKLAEDGQLPELQLHDGQQKQKKETKTVTVNPLVLFGLLSISAVLCAYLGLAEFGAPRSQKKDDAREVIKAEFFSPLDPREPLKPYQVDLRKARLANMQKDYPAERMLYKKVLGLLRQERPVQPENGKDRCLTGSRDRDEKLEEQISILLSND